MIYHTLPLNTPAMIIGPDEESSSTFSIALRSAGYSPVLMHSGQEALRNLPSFLPAVVIIDLYPPDTSVTEVIQYIRMEPHLEKTWIIVITSEPAMAQALQNVVDLVLIKPVSYTQLRDLALRFRRSSA